MDGIGKCNWQAAGPLRPHSGALVGALAVAGDVQALALGLFQRGRAESNVPGAGIGLAIVKSIADLHRGQLYAEARDGGGSCFRLTLPIDRPPKINFGDEN